MSNLIQAAREQVSQLTQAAYEKAASEGLFPAGQEIRGTVEVPKDSKNGDFASSFAMAGAKALHMAPRQIAQIILDHLELEGSLFQRAEIAGPGFLNFFYAPKWYGEVLAAVEAGCAVILLGHDVSELPYARLLAASVAERQDSVPVVTLAEQAHWRICLVPRSIGR